MNKVGKRILISSIAGLVVIGGSIGGFQIYQQQKIANSSVDVQAVSMLTTEYWEDTGSTGGQVTNDFVQELFPETEKTISKLFVKEGQKVKKGDPLLEFDREKLELGEQTASLNLKKIDFSIERAEAELRKLKGTTPFDPPTTPEVPEFPDDPGQPDFPDDPGQPDDPSLPDPPVNPTATPTPTATLYSELDVDAVPYAGTGTTDDPFRFLCTNEAKLTPGFLRTMLGLPADGTSPTPSATPLPGTPSLPVGSPTPTPTSEESNSDLFTLFPADLGFGPTKIYDVTLTTEETSEQATELPTATTSPVATPEPPAQATPTVDPTPAPTAVPTAEPTVAPATAEPATQEPTPTAPSSEPTPQPSASPEASASPSASSSPSLSPLPSMSPTPSPTPSGKPFAAVFEVRQDDNEYGPLLYGWSIDGTTFLSGFVMPPIHEGGAANAAGGDPVAPLSDISALSATDLGGNLLEGDNKKTVNNTDNGNDNADAPVTEATYTTDELKQLVREKEQEVKSLALQKKQAQLDYNKAKYDLDNTVVSSMITGVVKRLTDFQTANAEAKPFLTVSGGSGFYLVSSLSESLLGKVKAGDKITANSWETGATYEGEVVGISDYPVTSSYGYNPMPNNSNYELTAYFDEDTELLNGAYLDLRFTESGRTDNGMYLQSAYVRTDQDGSYVLKANTEGRIERQAIVTGKNIYNNQFTEIISGVTLEDKLAFPYGTSAVVGGRANDSESGEFAR